MELQLEFQDFTTTANLRTGVLKICLEAHPSDYESEDEWECDFLGCFGDLDNAPKVRMMDVPKVAPTQPIVPAQELQSFLKDQFAKDGISFPFFSVPRELRDEIYEYVLYRPRGLAHRRHVAIIEPIPGYRSFRFRKYSNPDFCEPIDIMALFLTSQKMYEEALSTFCRINTITINKRTHRPLAGTLRLFPEKAAQMLRSIELPYEDYDPNRHEEWNGPRPHITWEKIVEDAWVAKEFFPMLRRVKAIWRSENAFFEEAENMDFMEKTEETKVMMWSSWMRLQVQRTRQVPPDWLQVVFTKEGRPYRHMGSHQESFDQALQNIREERARLCLRPSAAELEASGRKWLEDTSNGCRTRSRRKKDRTCISEVAHAGH